MLVCRPIPLSTATRSPQRAPPSGSSENHAATVRQSGRPAEGERAGPEEVRDRRGFDDGAGRDVRDVARRFEPVAGAVGPPTHAPGREVHHVGTAVAVEVDDQHPGGVDAAGQDRRVVHGHRLAEHALAQVLPIRDAAAIDTDQVRIPVAGHVDTVDVRIGEIVQRPRRCRRHDDGHVLPSGVVPVGEKEGGPGAPQQIGQTVAVEVDEPARRVAGARPTATDAT